MTPPTKLAPLNPMTNQEAYRPLNPLALVGLGFGLLSLLIFATDAARLLLFLPLPGLVISTIAYRRIQRSEGTQAGTYLASAGLVFSLIGGPGWATKYVMTYAIIRGESARFLEDWIARLAKDVEGKEAFLDTVDPRYRKVPFPLDRPESARRLSAHFRNPGSGASLYDEFYADRVWTVLLRYGDRVEWASKGVLDWKYDKESYRVEHLFHVQTPELVGYVILVTKSEIVDDAATGSRRGWKLEPSGPNASRFTGQPYYTPYGAELRDVRQDAEQELGRWLHQVAMGQHAEAFAQTLGPAEKRGLTAGSLGSLTALSLSLAPCGALVGSAAGAAAAPGLPPVEPFDELYAALRANAPPLEVSKFQPSKIQLIRDRKEDGRWSLDYRGLAQNHILDVDFEVSLQGHLEGNRSVWQLGNCRVVNKRKHQEPGKPDLKRVEALPG